MCNHNCADCSIDSHANEALDLVDRVHAKEVTLAASGARIPAGAVLVEPDWGWGHTAKVWGVAIAQAVLITAVLLPVMVALAWVIVKVLMLL